MLFRSRAGPNSRRLTSWLVLMAEIARAVVARTVWCSSRPERKIEARKSGNAISATNRFLTEIGSARTMRAPSSRRILAFLRKTEASYGIQIPVVDPDSNRQEHEEETLERFGACRMPGCGCTAFKRTPSEEQFCDNCDHPRSQHIS